MKPAEKAVRLNVTWTDGYREVGPGGIQFLPEHQANELVRQGHAEFAGLIPKPGHLWVELIDLTLILAKEGIHESGDRVELPEADALELIRSGHAKSLSPESGTVLI